MGTLALSIVEEARASETPEDDGLASQIEKEAQAFLRAVEKNASWDGPAQRLSLLINEFVGANNPMLLYDYIIRVMRGELVIDFPPSYEGAVFV